MNNPNLSPNDDDTNNETLQNLTNQFHDLIGIKKPEGFSLQEMFSEIFRKRSDTEIEEYFTVGVQSTTPTIENVDTNWPKPWVFFRTLVGALVIYFCFVMAWREFQNIYLIPGLITIGSFATPGAVLIFFFEVNVRKNVSLYQIIRLLLFGGILSLIFSLFLFQVTASLKLQWLGASLAGIAEEPGKLLALILVINNRKYPYILNGLLFGAAIGAGFAAFESAGYALERINSPNLMLDVIVLRGLLAPFAHVVWTAMSAGALWKVKGNNKFNFNMLVDKDFTKVFGVAIVLHMVWNSPLSGVIPFYLLNIMLGFVAWKIIFGLIYEGLMQLSQEKEEKRNLQS